MTQDNPRNEAGAVAIMVSVCAVLLFSVAALAVDLGNGVARKRDLQTQADLTALAAAALLPAPNAAIPAAANTFAEKNAVVGQSDWNFVDSNPDNGFLEYVGNDQVRVVAPQSRVNFALAPVVGLPNHVNVSAVAAASIKSPGRGLPFFVSTACGWGLQTILDQTKGPTVPPGYTPSLSPTTSPAASVEIADVTPSSAELNGPSTSITVKSIANNGMNNVNRVGFTTEAGNHYDVTVSGSGNSLTVVVPSGVLAHEAVWWVRLRQGSQNRWSASANAKTFIVGNPEDPSTAGTCDSKNNGNFGSLELSRSDVDQPSRYLVENMALGIQHDLDKFPPPVPSGDCAGESGAVMDTGTPVAGRLLTCLETDTGSDLAQKATDAFITGTAQGTPPRLSGIAKPTRSGCDPSGGSSNRVMSSVPGAPAINDDVLSCFITDPNVTVGDVTKAAGAPQHVLSVDIFKSPRFFWVPVLSTDPAGGSGSYAVVEMRPVFITAQPDAATEGSPLPAQNVDNGIVMSSNGKAIEKIRVRAINPASLPEQAPPDIDGSMPYVGSGTKVIRLVE